jgi:hypothetical protein
MGQLTFEQLPGAVAELNLKVDRLLQFLSNKPDENRVVWFDINELIDYLPDHPAIPTIYAKVGRREIPSHKKGKKLIFLKSEIDEYLHDGKRLTTIELIEQADQNLIRPSNNKGRYQK